MSMIKSEESVEVHKILTLLSPETVMFCNPTPIIGKMYVLKARVSNSTFLV